MKGLKRAVVAATAITAVMASTLAVPASATTAPEWGNNGGQERVHGDTYLVEPEIEVELPGDMTFGINPLKLEVSEDPAHSEKSQIISGSYTVKNFSNVPVAVSAATSIKANADLAIVGTTGTGSSINWASNTWDATNASELKAVAGKKAVLLLQLYPKTIDNDGNMTMDTLDLKSATKPNTIKGEILSTTAPAKPVCFVLNAFEESKAKDSIGGFKFGGAVDPNAYFTEDDIVLNTVFTMDILTDAQKNANYKEHTTTSGFTGSSTTIYSTVKEKK